MSTWRRAEILPSQPKRRCDEHTGDTGLVQPLLSAGSQASTGQVGQRGTSGELHLKRRREAGRLTHAYALQDINCAVVSPPYMPCTLSKVSFAY